MGSWQKGRHEGCWRHIPIGSTKTQQPLQPLAPKAAFAIMSDPQKTPPTILHPLLHYNLATFSWEALKGGNGSLRGTTKPPFTVQVSREDSHV